MTGVFADNRGNYNVAHKTKARGGTREAEGAGMDYEGQICRAPMERASFMLPIMVGCSYNKCKFCNLFRHLKYRVLPIEQVEDEVKRVSAVGGNPRKVFFGDGNAFTLPTSHLLEVLDLVHEHFPACEMVNMDATVTSILHKSDEELRQLADAGVKHLYLGIEAGLPDVLEFMNKDHTVEQAREAIARIQAVGMCFDAHIMTGVAGEGRGEENAHALAAFLNETKPAHVCNFSLFLHDEVPLWKDVESGAFKPATELDNLKEERILIEELYADAPEGLELKYDGFHDYIAERVRGTLPRDREKMLAKLDGIIAEYEAEDGPIYSFVSGPCSDPLSLETMQRIYALSA